MKTTNKGFLAKIFEILEKIPIYSIITLVIGLLLLIFPGSALALMLRIGGILILVYSIYKLISIFVLDTDIFSGSLGFFATVATLTVGIILVINPSVIGGIVFTLFGLYLATMGIFSLWRASMLDAHYEFLGIKKDKTTQVVSSLLSIVTLLLGIILIVFPLTLPRLAITVSGICLVIEGIKSATVKIIEIVNERKTDKTSTKENLIEADFVDKTDENN